MRKFFKNRLHYCIVISAICLVLFIVCLAGNVKPKDIKEKAAELKEYCAGNGYNTDYAILVDYRRCSFQKRLFVYDFRNDKVLMKTLAGHGSGGDSTFLKPDFSNVSGSHCSSLGHYKIGKERKMYNRPLCPAFELDGLDKTNSNARSRAILIHPSVGPLSWGCVTLPFSRYHQLSELLKSQSQNVIMWVYEN